MKMYKAFFERPLFVLPLLSLIVNQHEFQPKITFERTSTIEEITSEDTDFLENFANSQFKTGAIGHDNPLILCGCARDSGNLRACKRCCNKKHPPENVVDRKKCKERCRKKFN